MWYWVNREKDLTKLSQIKADIINPFVSKQSLLQWVVILTTTCVQSPTLSFLTLDCLDN